MKNFLGTRVVPYLYPFFLIAFFIVLVGFIIVPRVERILTRLNIGSTPVIPPPPVGGPTPTPNPSARTFFVSPGKGNSSIQKALDQAQPGDTITLDSGLYWEDLQTVRNGTLENPITIIGPASAIVKGSGDESRVIEINHSYIHLIGFTVDGFHPPIGEEEYSEENYQDKLIYVLNSEAKKPLLGLQIHKMTLKNAGGECVRLRYLVTRAELAYNTITNCGIHDFRFKAGGKNGEGIYIGTAPEQRADGKNPTPDIDASNYNWIHHNTINTQGNECVDIKEGTQFNMVEYNSCTGQRDPNSAGLDSRGEHNTFRLNEVFNSIGAGVRLGGDSETDGINNEVYGNILRNNKKGGVKIERIPQGKVCNNEIIGNSEELYAVGKFGHDVDPTLGCE